MEMLSVASNIKVKTFKQRFKKNYGVEIRVYKGRRFADNDVTLASIRVGDCPGEVRINPNMLVGNLEGRIKKDLGVVVQIEDSKGSIANIDHLRLSDLRNQDPTFQKDTFDEEALLTPEPPYKEEPVELLTSEPPHKEEPASTADGCFGCLFLVGFAIVIIVAVLLYLGYIPPLTAPTS